MLFHVEYGPRKSLVDRTRHKLMKVTWKFADEPFNGVGIEVVRVERDWRLIQLLYDNAYGQAASFGVGL